MYVADPGATALLTFDIPTMSGTANVAPFQEVVGNNTQLNQPYGVAVDDDVDEYVANHGANLITTYGWFDTGNVTPQGTITGAVTKVNTPWDTALDYKNDTVYALNGNQSITSYPEGVFPSPTPLQNISGLNTKLGDGRSIAVDNSGLTYNEYFYATNKTAGELLMFAPGATGNVAPFHTLQGGPTQLVNPQGVAVDGSGYVYVTNTGNGKNQVLVYAPAPNNQQAPVRVISGNNTGLASPFGVTVGTTDGFSFKLLVSNASSSPSITIYPLNANGNVAPFATIQGGNTKLVSPANIYYAHVCHPA